MEPSDDRVVYASEGRSISLRSEEFKGPVSLLLRPVTNVLCLSLPPVNFEGAVRFPEAGILAMRKVGRSFFSPAGQLMESRGSGGFARWLSCDFTDDVVCAAIGDHTVWPLPPVPRASDLTHTPVMPILVRLANEATEPGIGHLVLMESLLTQAIIELARFLAPFAREATSSGKLTPLQLKQIEERVLSPDLRLPTVAELALQCRMSERHLLRLFKATTGESVSGYVRRELVSRARRLLANRRLPLKTSRE